MCDEALHVSYTTRAPHGANTQNETSSPELSSPLDGCTCGLKVLRRNSSSGLLTIRVTSAVSVVRLELYICAYSHGSSINSNYLMWDLLCVCQVRGMNACWRVWIYPVLMFISEVILVELMEYVW